jgi:hypothetical protein
VNAGVITGDTHFSIVGGFTPALVAGTPGTYSVHFDTTGTVFDSVYTATLTFSSADEALPGALPQPDLVVTLRAQPIDPNAGVPGTGELPTTVRFYPPRPNPAMGPVRMAFDLPRSARVTLEVFDLSGRRVADLVSGGVEPGHHELRWDSRGDGVAAGLYFVRFSTPGHTRTSRLVLLP